VAKRKKTRFEISQSFHVNEAEVERLLECGRTTAGKIFDVARLTDMHELGANYFDHRKVRLTSVLKAAGISEREMKEKIQP
jgi:hypothetical protein